MSAVNGRILGAWVSDEPGRPTLVFHASGAARGSDGCNRIVSKYEETDAGARIAPFVITAVACVGVDQWLAGVASVTLAGGTLTVANAAGVVIGELRREA